jgi:hypothetical protein
MVNKNVKALTQQQMQKIKLQQERENKRLARHIETEFALALRATRLQDIRAARSLVYSLPVEVFDRAIEIGEASHRRDYLAVLIRWVFLSIEPNTDRYKNYAPDLKRITKKLEALEAQRKQERAMKRKSKNGRSLAGTEKRDEIMKNEYCPSHRHSPKKRILEPGRQVASPI